MIDLSNIDLGLNVIAEITPKNTKLFLEENKRNLPTKVISTAEFIRILSSIKNEDEREESPLLPGDYGTKKMLKSGNDYFFLMTTPPKIRELNYTGMHIGNITYFDSEDYEGCVDEYGTAEDEITSYLEDRGVYSDDDFTIKTYTPSMVWFIQIKEDLSEGTFRFVKDRIFSKESIMLSMKDEIYPAPFSNVYYENKVCWGEVDMPHLTIPGLMAVERIFFNVDFNMDLEVVKTPRIDIGDFEYKSKFLHLIESQRLLEEYGEQRAKDYIHDIMRRADPGITYTIEEEWNEFIGGSN